MRPPGHAAVSLALGGGTWLATGSPGSVVVALLVGVLLDLDHLLDYYRWLILDRTNRIWLFLHSYELVIPAILLYYLSDWDPLVLGGTLGFLGHILSDQWAHKTRAFTYFFTFRVIKGFRASEIAHWSRGAIYRDLLRLPFMRHLLRPAILRLRKLSGR